MLASGDERQGLLAALRDVTGVLAAGDAELRLGPDELHDVAVAEVVAGGQAPGEVDHRGTLHQGVVDVEERGGRQVRRHLRGYTRLVDLDGGDGALVRDVQGTLAELGVRGLRAGLTGQ